MRARFIVLLPFFLTSYLSAQTDSAKCKQVEDSLIVCFKKQRAATTDKERSETNSLIKRQFEVFFNIPGSFQYPLNIKDIRLLSDRVDTIRYCGHFYSPDKLFRLITWNVEMADGTHQYYGYVEMDKPQKGKRIFELTDKSSIITNPEQSVLSPGKWYGGLYYKILRNKVDQRVYYTILALKYNNLFVSSKFIEVMYFDEFGNPVFGAPVFQLGPRLKKLRMVFEYSAMVTMSLRYDELQKKIIFDHLSPSEPRYTGMYQFYGPDLSFDGLMFDKNRWVYVSKIEVRSSSPSKVKPPFHPR
jgi:hypothetical protein